jgi:hypothetical protein
MYEAGCLVLNRLYDCWMAVSCAADSDSGAEIQKAVPIQVPYLGTLSAIHHKGIGTRIRWGEILSISLDPGFAQWTG